MKEPTAEHSLSAHLTPEQVMDHALGLTAGGESAWVARHVRLCAGCRAAVQREREIGRKLHATLLAFPPPPDAHLPALRARRSPPRQPALALVGLMLLLWLGNVGWQRSLSPGLNPYPPPITRLAPVLDDDAPAADATRAQAVAQAPIPSLPARLLTLPAPQTTPTIFFASGKWVKP